MTKLDYIKKKLPKVFSGFSYEVFQEGNKYFIKLLFKKQGKEFLMRVLLDKHKEPQIVYSYDFMDFIAPDEISDDLPNCGFISSSAYKMWEELCYPLPKDDIKRRSDNKLIELIKENSYDVFENTF